ncbi:MAG: Glutamyl-tRNA(Gln) amidotransferase subunit A [Chlamydiae bacterium]|nr:Glutamyl-tRNA(Gln) amidotransferase subunit A [Chlamydiota bacterium]
MHKKSATQLRDDFASHKISAEEITSYYLNRIKKLDEKLGAFLTVFEERALKKAKMLDAKRAKNGPLGKLAGVPILLKDNMMVQGEICSCGSKMLENYRATYDATVTTLLEEEDAILIGKGNMDEFAMGGSGIHSAFGPTKNPWNLACSPGGSSSGPAAAVSAGLCSIALGSDTGGSIRQPAALSGITGFKPTYGRVSRYGLVAFASSLDQIGPFARDVKDIALAMEVLGKHCNRDATSLNAPPTAYTVELDTSLSGKRIGVPRKFLEDLDGENRKNFDAALEILKSMDCKIVDIDLSILKYGIAIYYILATAEGSTNLARFDGIRYGYRDQSAQNLDEIYKFSRSKGFGWEVKNRILLGTSVLSSGSYEEYYAKAQKIRSLIIQKMRTAFGKCDMIAMPTTPTTAFPLEGIDDPLSEYLQDFYTVGANLAGLPAISVPNGLSLDGKPFAIQFVGPQTRDADVLRFAHAFQSEVGTLFPPDFGGDL